MKEEEEGSWMVIAMEEEENWARLWMSKQALEFWRLQLVVKIMRKKDNGRDNDWYEFNKQCC